jgi:uncharacterized protein YjiS (DUF1127 family)
MSTGEFKCSRATLAQHPAGLGAAGALRWGRAGLRLLERAADLVLAWQERAQQRRQLETLSDHMLRDIGLTRADVLAESTKRFWQP